MASTRRCNVCNSTRDSSVSADRTLQRVWYERSPVVLFLLLTPLSVLFALIAWLRRAAYRSGIFKRVRVERPVIVVGNITVGGTGKTPLVIWVTELLQTRGYRVGVVSRGYGGSATRWPQVVTSQSRVEEVGDEAALIAGRTNAVVVASPDRVEAAQRAIELGAQVIVSDDGLQHYRLARDAEIVVMDASRRSGNGWLLPAGPLREPTSRLRTADAVIATSRSEMRRDHAGLVAQHEIRQTQCIATGERRELSAFIGTTVHAVAGIGNPEAFFLMLRRAGLTIEPHALPDHATVALADITFEDSAPVLMTEKDAVKCRAFANDRHWAVRLDVTFAAADEAALTAVLMKAAQSTVARSDTR